MITKYSYNELYNAVKDDPTQENIEKLVCWLNMFDPAAWNGEKYFADDLEIFPVFDEDLYIVGFSVF